MAAVAAAGAAGEGARVVDGAAPAVAGAIGTASGAWGAGLAGGVPDAVWPSWPSPSETATGAADSCALWRRADLISATCSRVSS